MGKGDAPSSRRRFLALTAGSGPVALAGCTTTLSDVLTSGHTAVGSTTVGPDSEGLTDDERERYVDRMGDRYGSRAADQIVPEATAVSQRLQPGSVLDERVWDETQSLAVTDSAGPIAELDAYLALYENAQLSSTAADGYVYWLWSAARPRNAGVLRELWSHVDVTGGEDVLVYDPGGDRRDNGTVGPHPEKTGGDTDEFAVRWQGEHTAQQVVTGSFSTSRDDGDERGFQWTVHLTARTR